MSAFCVSATVCNQYLLQLFGDSVFNWRDWKNSEDAPGQPASCPAWIRQLTAEFIYTTTFDGRWTVDGALLSEDLL
ncbi:TPA: hypothetical protein ACHJVX_005226, partial [Klebsiella pneumoniae]